MSEPRSVQLYTIVLISALLLLAGVSCNAASSEPPRQPTAVVAEQPVPSATPLPAATAEPPPPTEPAEAPLPAGWTTFTNQRCAYTISYPAEMGVAGQGTSSQSLAFNLDSPGRGPLNFIYVSVIDHSSPTAGQEIIYNYDPAESAILLNMQVGESNATRDIADVAEFFTYERKPDTPIAGHDAQTYENVRPWEFPEGTKEIRHYLSLDGCTFLIGGYVDATASGQPGAIDEGLFNQVIATVQFP